MTAVQEQGKFIESFFYMLLPLLKRQPIQGCIAMFDSVLLWHKHVLRQLV